MKATIQSVKLVRIDEVWKKHKPQGLGFSDNDAIVLTLKTEKGKKISQTFYCRIKGDGTLGHSITKASEKRQQNLRNFIKNYISEEKRYNIRKNHQKWKGKKVDVIKVEDGYILKI